MIAVCMIDVSEFPECLMILKQHILHEQTTLNIHQNMHKWMDWSPATEETSLTGLEEVEVNLKV